MYDRCPLCRRSVTFHGISIKPVWMKWMWCELDQTFHGVNEFGMPQVMTKKIPASAVFVKFTDRPKKKGEAASA